MSYQKEINNKSFEINDLKAQLQEKSIVVNELKQLLATLKGKSRVTPYETPNLDSRIESEPINAYFRNNEVVHQDYLKVTKDHIATLQELLEQARALNPLDENLDYAYCNANVKNVALSLNSKNVCLSCNVCLYYANHDACVVNYLKDVQKCKKAKFVKQKKRFEWKPTGRIFNTVGQKWIPTGRTFNMVGNQCPLTRITPAIVVPPGYYGLWKFVDWNILISRVYYIEGLGHNLFSVGQFCDLDLDVAFRKHTCFVRNLEGVDLLSGSRRTNHYTISMDEMMKSSPICLLYKASKTKSWKNTSIGARDAGFGRGTQANEDAQGYYGVTITFPYAVTYHLEEKDKAINIQLLPYFKPVQPHTKDRYEPLEEDTDYISNDELEIGEQRMINHTDSDKPFTPKPQPEDGELISDEDLDDCGYDAVYGKRENEMLEQWMCFRDHERQRVDRNRMIIIDFLKVRYGNKTIDDATRERLWKNAYALDDVWEKCKKFHGGTLYPWHDEGFEEEEQWESGIEKIKYEPPSVNIETFEIKRFSQQGNGIRVQLSDHPENETLRLVRGLSDFDPFFVRFSVLMDSRIRRTRALEQETRDLDVEIKQIKDLNASYGVTTPKELRRESLSEAWTLFKDILQKVHHHGMDLWLQIQIFYKHVNHATRCTIDQSAGGKLRNKNGRESLALIEDLTLYDNESWNDPGDFTKPVHAISLPRDVPNVSDHHLIELENQVQCLMEAHLAPKLSVLVNKITSSCEICSDPQDT
ncbi:hypothetical protein Tco_1254645 [Tanacetum coccineum]